MATVDVDILQVDTSKSQQSIAGLRNEIKSLKDQLVNLDEGTKEYNDTLLALGDRTHQLKEIQEQVKQTTTDFGDRLSNVRGTITGAAGAFQTVIGSLSLMGVNIGDDVKALKMLQSAMAITQGVAAIDAGVKSFKALAISIKASVTAANGLKSALIKTGIGAIVVAAGVLIGKLIELRESHDDAAEAAKREKEALDKLEASTERLISRMERLQSLSMDWYDFWNYDEFNDELAKIQQSLKDGTVTMLQLENETKNFRRRLAGKDDAWRYTEEGIKAHKIYYANLRAMALIYYNDLEGMTGEAVMKQRAALQEQYVRAQMEEREFLKKIEADTASRRARARAQQEADAAKLKEATQNLSKARDEYAKSLLDEQGQLLFSNQLLMQRNREILKETGLTEGQILTANNLTKEQAKLAAEYLANTTAITKNTESLKANEKEIEETARQTRMAQQESEAEIAYHQQQAEIIIANRKTRDEELLQAEIDFTDKQEELLRQRYEQGLITRDEFNSQIADIELKQAQLQIEQEEAVTAKTQAELEKRKKIHQNYAKATGTVVDSVCNILGSIGSTLEQGTAEWKAVMTAQAIISTIKGGIDSYMGMIASIPGPAGIIAGVAAAVATVAAGMAEVAKIQSTEVSTTGSSSASTNSNTALGNVNAGAVSMLSTQVTNTRNIATEDDITELPATRVYVLESDITESQNRVRTTVENSTY